MSLDDEELEQIRQKKMMELQQRLAEEEARRRRELERAAAMRVILTPEARQRLANLRLIRPELVAQLEEYLIRLANAGRIQMPVTDETLKQMLSRLDSGRRRNIRIIRK